MSVSHINDLSELPVHSLQQVHRFFSDYKALEKKTVKVEHFKGREEALKVVKTAIELYDKTFGESSEKKE